MTGLLSIGSKAKTIDAVIIAIEVLNRESTKEFIKELSTKDQLFEKGQDRFKVSLGSYSDPYKKVRSREGLPSSPVSLFRTGKLYKSYDVEIQFPSIIITADDQVGSDYKLTDSDRFKNFLGLNDENIEKLESFVIREVIDIVLQRLLS